MIRKIVSIALIAILSLAAFSNISAQNRLKRPKLVVDGTTVTWNAVKGAATYQGRYRIGDSAWVLTEGTAGRLIGFPDLAAGAEIRVQVRAKPPADSNAKNSRWSKTAIVTKPKPPPPPPAPPTAIPLPKVAAPLNIQHAVATLSWDAVPNAAAYFLVIKDQMFHTRTTTATITATTYEIEGAKPGDQYAVQIQSRGDGTAYQADGHWSAVYTFRVVAAPAPTATQPQPEATATQQTSQPNTKPDSGGTNNEGGNREDTETETTPKPKPDNDNDNNNRPNVCVNSRPCSASSGVWSSSFTRNKVAIYDHLCVAESITRQLQRFTCSNTCPPANESSHTRVISQKSNGHVRVPC
jgi:hypothetical protein